MQISVQTTLHVGDQSLVRSPDDSLRHVDDFTQVTTSRCNYLIFRRCVIRSSLGPVDFMTAIRLNDLDELFMTTLIVIGADPTLHVGTELIEVVFGTNKVDRHVREVPDSRMT